MTGLSSLNRQMMVRNLIRLMAVMVLNNLLMLMRTLKNY